MCLLAIYAEVIYCKIIKSYIIKKQKQKHKKHKKTNTHKKNPTKTQNNDRYIVILLKEKKNLIPKTKLKKNILKD